MRFINVYNDIHLYGVHALDNIQIDYTEDDFHIGDNVDMKGVHKKKISSATDSVKLLKAKSLHYVSGNHELDLDPDTHYHVDRNILYTHGDFLVWSDESALKFRSKKIGRGRFMRFILKMSYPFRKFKKPSMKEEFLERCYEKCKELDCHTVVMGHRHPKEPMIKRYKGKTIMILPRGKSKLGVWNTGVTFISNTQGEK